MSTGTGAPRKVAPVASEPEPLVIPDDMLSWSVIGAFVRGATSEIPRATIVSISTRQLAHLVAAADTHGGGVAWELDRLAEFGVVDLVVRLNPPKETRDGK